jgi:hypothetical protein
MLRKRLSNPLFLALLLMVIVALPSFAGNLNLKYEQVITDSYGNELGYRTYTITSIDQLPLGSPWRDYLNTKLQSGKTIYEYATSISKSLSKDFNLTLSDRECNSYSSKASDGSYNLNIYTYVNDFASDSSKTFLFMHEFGHVVMLNSYPRSYDFGNLDYGSDNKHYLDEILPNHNTSWVEGWANAFAAANNNGMVFSYDLKKDSTLDFLRENSFDEMCRNEVFVAKVLYDSFKDIKDGQAAAYDVFARTAPHYSLYEFCQNYVRLYPQNQVELAKILVNNSYGNITLKELLAYINGGSNTVSRELYNYLQSSGMLNGTASNNYASTKPTTTTTTKTSFWSRIVGFFKGIFGKGDRSNVAASPKSSKGTSVGVVSSDESIYNRYTDGTIAISSSIQSPTVSSPIANSNVSEGRAVAVVTDKYSMTVEEAQEEYFKYYSEYTELVKSSNPDKNRLIEVRNRMVEAQKRLNKLQGK